MPTILYPKKSVLVRFILTLFVCSPAIIQGQSLDGNLYEDALRRHNSKKLAALEQNFFNNARQSGNVGQANYYAHLFADAYSKAGNTRFKEGDYIGGISYALAGSRWLSRSHPRSDSLHFQLLSLAASCYGRIPLADSATYWYVQTSNFLSAHTRLRQQIPVDVCGYYMSYAYFLSRTGDSRRAFDYLQIAAQLAEKTKNRRLLAIINNYLGNYFYQIRQFDQAGIYYKRALLGYEAGTTDRCWGYILLGNNYRAAGHPAIGLTSLKKGQQLYQKIINRQADKQDNDLVIQASYYTAECQRALNQLTNAARSYRSCIAQNQASYGQRGEFISYSWIGLGRIAQRHSLHKKALTLAQQAVRAACYRLGAQESSTDYVGTVVNEKALYEALQLEADIWQGLWEKTSDWGALRSAVWQYDLALKIAARLRRNLVPEESKFFLSTTVKPCVERAVIGCFTLCRQTKADTYKNLLFDLIERHRMMTTADLLHEKYRMTKAIPARVIVREQALKRQKLSLEKAVADWIKPVPADSLQRQLNAIKVTSYQFLDSLEWTYPRYYALKYDSHAFSITDLRQRLSNRMGYLTYFVGDRYLVGFLVSQTQSRVFRVSLTDNFDQVINQLWQSIRQDPGMFTYTGQSQATRLYGLLIRPIEPQISSLQRLIISRDGLLHYVPFDLLQRDNPSTDYLGNHVAISYGYSAALTFTPTATSTTTPIRPSGYAPYYALSGGRPAKTFHKPLPQSQAEVQAWHGRLLLGKQATKADFLSTVAQSDVVILATHALANEQQPERSYIAFHPSQKDYRLQATEILNLSLDNLKFLVLSACAGNGGLLQADEGLLSLARAFRLAGCRAVLTTSWQASDESTAAMNQLFHQHLTAGLSTDLALQRARTDFRNDKRFRKWNHPYHWANFTLIGTPVVLYPRSVFFSVLVRLAGFIGFLLTGWLGYQWYKRRLIKPFQTL